MHRYTVGSLLADVKCSLHSLNAPALGREAKFVADCAAKVFLFFGSFADFTTINIIVSIQALNAVQGRTEPALRDAVGWA